MFRAYGLRTHIWNNNLRSLVLLAGFPLLLALLTYGLFLGFAALVIDDGGHVEVLFIWAAEQLARAWPWAIVGAGVWFAIAYVFFQSMLDAATGAHAVERTAEPRLYNLLENLCISRGLKTPTLRIIEADALNAYASGLQEGRYTVTVTRGLMQTLDDSELEAVLAHELTHIRNKDARLLVVAVIFVGIFSFVFQLFFEGLFRSGALWSGGSSRRSSSSDRDRGGGGGGAVIALLVALACIALAYALAVVIRFTLSRNREFLADAGAVELTKNPDAMISALRKISGRAQMPNAPSEVREMFFENAAAGAVDLFATHPPIEKRIAALVTYAGGRDMGAVEAAPTRGRSGPWG
jgi:heat shock protein HtpX